jgi:hypothetical protein
MASVPLNSPLLTCGGSKSQSPILIASKMDLGTAVLLAMGLDAFCPNALRLESRSATKPSKELRRRRSCIQLSGRPPTLRVISMRISPTIVKQMREIGEH